MEKREELEELLTELQRRKEQSRYEFFSPNGKQEDFIKVVGQGKHKFYIFQAGNGVGKDCVSEGNILANIVWGPQNNFFKGLPLFEKWPFPKHLRIVTDPQLALDSGPIRKEITHWWPQGRYTESKAGKQYTCQYKSDTGFFIDVMTYEQAVKDFEGATIGCFVFSEPPPEPIFDACVGRLREGGIMLFPMTPLRGSAWLMDRLLDDPKTAVVRANTEDNCIDHGIRGHLKHRDIQDMIESWPPEEREARFSGNFVHLSYTVLGGAFRREWQVIPNDVAPPDGAEWGYTVDPHGSKPFAIGYWWVSPTGQIVFDSEWPLEDFTKVKESKLVLKDYVEQWKVFEMGKRINKRIIDRHFANSRDYRGRTLLEELEDDYHMQWENSYNTEEEIETGIIKVKSGFAFNTKAPIDTINQPQVLIKARCTNIIRALERWARSPETGKPDVKSVYKDHFDVVRYTVMAEPKIYISRPYKYKAPGYIPGR